MKLIRWAIVAVWALLGCGGEAEVYPLPFEPAVEEPGDGVTPGDGLDDVELGIAEQAVTVKEGHGFNCGNNALDRTPYRCQQFVGLETDRCGYPYDKSRKFCADSDFMSAGQLTEANADIDAILPTLTSQFGGAGWSFSRSCSTPDVLIRYQNIPAGQSKTSILGYVRVWNNANGALLLNESAGGFEYNGSHVQQTSTGVFVVTVDRAEINAQFTGSDRDRVRRHAFYGGMYAAGTGLGFTPSHVNRATSIAITATAAKLTSVSSAEQCRVNAYVPTANGLFDVFFDPC